MFFCDVCGFFLLRFMLVLEDDGSFMLLVNGVALYAPLEIFYVLLIVPNFCLTTCFIAILKISVVSEKTRKSF